MTSHAAAPEMVIITGMSGAGRSTAAKSLEDLDWFVADNLPPAMLVTMLDLARRARAEVPRVAAVVDIRSRVFSTDLTSANPELDAICGHPFVVGRAQDQVEWLRARGQAFHDSGRRLHGREAPQRGDRRGTRGQAGRAMAWRSGRASRSWA